MPTIDLQGRDPQYQLLEISSIMCFPSDKESKARRNWMLKQLLGVAATHYNDNVTPGKELELSVHIGKWLGEVVYYLGGWGALANATVGHGQKKSAVEEARQRMKQCVIVASCFRYGLSAGGGISTGAKQLHTDKAKAYLKKHGITPPLASRDHIINKLWPRYRCAVHLWAAFLDNRQLAPQNPLQLFALDQFDSGFESKGLAGFIKLADLYLKKGTLHIPKPGPKKPLLNIDTAWRIKI